LSGRRKIALALLGLLVAFVASIPLIQRLSVELVQLQIRERLDDHKTFAEAARDFEVPEDYLIDRLGLSEIPRDELRRLTLAELAARKGQSTREFKRDLIDAAFDAQFDTIHSPSPGSGN